MRSPSNPALHDFTRGDGSSVLKFSEVPSDGTDPNFLEGYISEQDYARRRGVTLRTCQRDRQLRKAPPYTKLGRQIFYRIDALREWMVKNERFADQMPQALRYRSPRNPYPVRVGRRLQTDQFREPSFTVEEQPSWVSTQATQCRPPLWTRT